MSNNKQSSVEWLVSKIDFMLPTYLIEQAKAMHKEEIIEHHTWLLSGIMSETFAKKDAEKYYNETFGGNNESN